jgi:hypothetical protein
MTIREYALLGLWIVGSGFGLNTLVRAAPLSSGVRRGIRRQTLGFLVLGLVIPVGLFAKPPVVGALPFSLVMIAVAVAAIALLAPSLGSGKGGR